MTDGILPLVLHVYPIGEWKHCMGDGQELLTELRNLDPQAISRVHELYFSVVYRYARYRLGDHVIAEDIASETFIRLIENIHMGRVPRTSLRGWLMGTASNLVNDYFRKVYSKPDESLSEMLPSQDVNPETLSANLDQRSELQNALMKLTDDQQHVIALRFGSSCSLTEVAEIMGKKPNAIKQLQFRALAALRRHLGGVTS